VKVGQIVRTLITGASGFVGAHLKRELGAHDYEVYTTDIGGNPDFILDLLDVMKVYEHLEKYKYDAVVHLAGFSSVKLSWEYPRKALELNVFPTLNLLDSISRTGFNTRVLLIGSSDQYGIVPQDRFLLTETDPCQPRSPYAISKCTQEQMAPALAASKKLDIIYTRSFNHIGPGQQKGFVVSDLTSAIVDIQNGSEPVLYVGNMQAYRDFSDVRDVVRAYRLLLEKGQCGEIYNVGSGAVHSIQSILQSLIELSGMNIEVRQDPAKFRPVEIYKIGCCRQKIMEHTGWAPEIDLKQSLKDTLAWWQQKLYPK
jgi:GDP-4-dehydro-6-deoxy-D-mannose reductase